MSDANSRAHRLDGRIALVTGGGQGIGRATAIMMADAGAKVAVVDIDEDLAASVVAEIESAGGTATAIMCDVTSEQDVEASVKRACNELGPVTILLNNAGGGNPPSTITSPRSQWDKIISLNLGSVISMSRAVWPVMVEQGGGVILSASSQSARRAMESLSPYGAAKAAIVQLTRSLALEGAPVGIRANCVAPGWVLTPAVQTWFDTQDDPQAVEAEAAASIPIGRLATPEDIAYAYCFLASDAAAYITGTELWCDGGTTLG
jgi:NAD(P)-dependent dehydrogenase (short-subunit alcohol dehydrogenase family)